VPSFQQHLDTLERWRRFPGLERLTRPERLTSGSGRVALTFDDGPDPDGTPAVLDALEAGGVRATFFLVGEQLLSHRELGGEVARRGHAVALHGFRHEPHERLGAGAAREDLLRGLDVVEAATGRRPRLYRPPYGRFSDTSHAACLELGLEPVYWSAWGADWEDIGPERITDLVTRDLADGLIVLLHDSARYAHRPSPRATAEALPAIIAAAAERGLAFARLAGPGG
jgi:peptidoglycan/xylan/chitin deacetylase (PgdA/CDA1 family)